MGGRPCNNSNKPGEPLGVWAAGRSASVWMRVACVTLCDASAALDAMLLRTPLQHRATWRKHPKTGLNFTLQFGVIRDRGFSRFAGLASAKATTRVSRAKRPILSVEQHASVALDCDGLYLGMIGSTQPHYSQRAQEFLDQRCLRFAINQEGIVAGARYQLGMCDWAAEPAQCSSDRDRL
jgi:hypothetical protein